MAVQHRARQQRGAARRRGAVGGRRAPRRAHAGGAGARRWRPRCCARRRGRSSASTRSGCGAPSGSRSACSRSRWSPVPLLWFGPDAIGAGGALGASDAARGTASPQSAVNADFPALEVLVDFAELLTPPVLIARRRRRRARRPRRAAARGRRAGMGRARRGDDAGGLRGQPALQRRARRGRVRAGRRRRGCARPAPGAGGRARDDRSSPPTLAFTAGDLGDQLDELGARADRREQLDALVDRAGGRACEPARRHTNQPMKAMLAWRLDVSMEHLADPPRPPGSVFAAPPGYDGGAAAARRARVRAGRARGRLEARGRLPA